MAKFDRWTVIKILEVILVLVCLIFKRITDDEARSLFLYLQKLSREWSLLTNVTWDRIGSSLADSTYGGYLIITSALLIGNIFEELPTEKRIFERILLGIGAVLFIVLGSLCFAAIDSLPSNLVDNAAILGTLSVVVGALFILDMGTSKPIKKQSVQAVNSERKRDIEQPSQSELSAKQNGMGQQKRSIIEQVYDIEKEVEKAEKTILDKEVSANNNDNKKSKTVLKSNGQSNGGYKNGGLNAAYKNTGPFSIDSPILSNKNYLHATPTSKGYQQMKDDDINLANRFGIYGKDIVTDHDSETDETASIPPKIEFHTPVWSQIRKGEAKKYIVPPVIFPINKYEHDDLPERPPSGPLDPGYVQYTAQHWEESKPTGVKTPRHSPTEV